MLWGEVAEVKVGGEGFSVKGVMVRVLVGWWCRPLFLYKSTTSALTKSIVDLCFCFNLFEFLRAYF
jgi:hypothetical protein